MFNIKKYIYPRFFLFTSFLLLVVSLLTTVSFMYEYVTICSYVHTYLINNIRICICYTTKFNIRLLILHGVQKMNPMHLCIHICT